MIFIIISLIVIVGVTIFLICYLTQKNYNKFVLKNSVCLKQLNEVNSRYNFYPHFSFDQTHIYDNEKFYNTIACVDYLTYQLQYIRKNVCEQIEKTKFNKQQYSSYLSEIKAINQFGKFQAPIGRLKLDKLIKIERLLKEEQTLHAPDMQFTLTVSLCCSKINGQIYRRKSQTFPADYILTIIKKLNNRKGTFYNDREIWDAICRVERGKVSNKMRFSIYARDGYRCRKCGVSNRYAQLEVDHIIPIAKGGKTTYNNLQTLCHRCNVLKGDSLL